MSIYSNIFCGFYCYMLEAEKSEEKIISNYFAYSTLFILTFLEFFGFFSLSIFAGKPYYSYFSNIWLGLSVILLLFILNWFLFLRKEVYANIIGDFFSNENRQKSAKLSAKVFSAFIIFIFLTSVFSS